jgi:rare lipoprotein A
MMKIKKSTILSLALSISSLFLTTPVAARETVRTLGVKTVSWYGPGFHGRKTANGERFNQHAFTAAHKTLPFGTKLKVTCIATGKSAIVTVNDRGPFHGNRALDLSKAAASAIGLLDRGVGKVKIDVLQ